MKQEIYISLIIVVLILLLAWTETFALTEVSVQELAAIRGGCEGCETNENACVTKHCYAHAAGGYYTKVGTDAIVPVCSPGKTGGCEFYGDFVLCHTVLSDCVDDQCRRDCNNSSAWAYTDCRATE